MLRPHLLLADTPEALRLLVPIFSDQFELTCVSTLDSARAIFGNRLNLIVAGAHFDDCKLFDLLVARNNSPAAAIPFLCIRVLDGELDDTLYRSVVIATETLKASSFIDYSKWVRLHGRQNASERLLECALKLLG